MILWTMNLLSWLIISISLDFSTNTNHLIDDDQAIFRASFEESLAGRKELLAYVRLKCSTPAATYPFLPMKETLFEVKGYPRFVVEDNPGSGCQCFFAMAKPYNSRSITMCAAHIFFGQSLD
jgi:hypothetical protein